MTAVLTAVLVMVTAYYAWQTYRMVVEMRQDRRQRETPKVVLDLRSEGAAFAPPSVCNIGLGPALDVDVTMTFVPR
jgi:heme/copper-type cytochrome/quinol oxidase subunit 2